MSDNLLKNLKGIKQIHFFNDFNVSSNLLNTLKDCPKKIDGIFNCSNNNLINLKYSPEIIDGSFFCFKNKLKSLEGSPNEIKGSFDCRNNKIKNVLEEIIINKIIAKSYFTDEGVFNFKEIEKEFKKYREKMKTKKQNYDFGLAF